jgi:glycosyltransferase involved in cell wall biosynthesis
VIVTVSESSKRDILRVFDVDPEKVCVTYQTPALQPLLREESEVAKALRKYGLEYKRYLLFAGAIEPKKNVGRLIDAYVGVDTDMPLVLAGKKGWLWERELKTLRSSAGRKARQRIIILEHVPRPDLAMLYQGAVCFVFPSLYEGFGLPPLEAMGFDCPVLTSETASLPETCGDAAVYVDPYDVHDIRHGLEELLGNPVLQAKLVEKGRRRVEFFRIENYMERLRAAYAKVI